MQTTRAKAPRPRKERKENADRRRRQLLEATVRSVVVHGLAKTTLATVAEESGLSQGVIAFYFKNKGGLLTEALRYIYTQYEENWTSMLEAAEADDVQKLVALIRADFSPAICNHEMLSVWYSFWGEQKYTPQYAEIAQEYDQRRREELQRICRRILPPEEVLNADQVAEWIDTLTDGYWQKLHLLHEVSSRDHAIMAALECVCYLAPDAADRIRAEAARLGLSASQS